MSLAEVLLARYQSKSSRFAMLSPRTRGLSFKPGRLCPATIVSASSAAILLRASIHS